MKRLSAHLQTIGLPILAVVVVFIAAIVIAMPFLNDYLAKHRQDFEKLASSYVHEPIQIGSAHMSWDQYSPAIRFDNVIVSDQLSKQTMLQMSQVRIRLALWRSLWQRQSVVTAHINQLTLGQWGERFFLHPLTLDNVRATFDARKESSDWLLDIHKLQGENSDVDFNVTGLIHLPPKALPTVDLTATTAVADVGKLANYFPIKVMQPELTAWLQQAFISGNASATAVLRGSLADFPFDAPKSGFFSIEAQGHDLDFSFAPHWPHVLHAEGKLNFTGRVMQIHLQQGTLSGIALANVQGTIPYVGKAKPQILHIQTPIVHTDLTQGLAFVATSPAQKKLGKLLKGITLTGPIDCRLGLVIPVKHPAQTTVLGNLNLKQATLKAAEWHVTLSQLTGPITFTANSVSSQTITGLLFNQPIRLQLATLADAAHTLQVTFNVNLQTNTLQQALNLSLSKWVQGGTAITGTLDLSDQAPIQVHLQSNLRGLAVLLPGKLAKPAGAATVFSADLIAADNLPLKLQVQEGLFSAALVFPRDNNQLKLDAINLWIGKGIAPWPVASGLFVAGELDQLDFNDLKPYLNNMGNNSFNLPPLKKLTAQIKTLGLGAVVFKNFNMTLTPLPQAWLVAVSATGTQGSLTIPTPFSATRTLTAQFAQLTLNSPGSTAAVHQAAMPNIKASVLPSIIFQANQLTYGDLPLGQVAFKTTPTPDGLSIDQLTVNFPHALLQASGKWVNANNTNLTQLHGRMRVPHITQFLRDLHVNANNIVISQGSLNFDFSWNDTPIAFSLAHLLGQAHLKVGHGQIVNLGRGNETKLGIGRLLSIFSLQAIPSHLMSGFSDLFQKGYGFNSIVGDFNVKNGDLFTSNLRFEGPVAGVSVKGRIGLVAKDFNCIMGVTPYVVTSTVPAAAGFLGGPVVGLAALAVNVVVSKVTTINTYYYAVTGPWANPTWKRM